MSDEILQPLSQVDLFQGLSNKVLKHIASEGTTRTYAPGEAIVEEGASVSGWSSFSREGVCFYVILEGSGDVEVHGVPKGTLSAGQYFGEASLIDGQPRTATVVAGANAFANPSEVGSTMFAMRAEPAMATQPATSSRAWGTWQRASTVTSLVAPANCSGVRNTCRVPRWRPRWCPS